MTTWDAIVVGAGPGGALTAQALARRGAQVLLLDRQSFPRWKVCGACLSRGALETLTRAGLADLASDLGAVPLRHLELASGARRATLTLDGSVALSRGALDQALVRAAVAAGAGFLPGARATLVGLTPEARLVRVRERAIERTLAARVVIDACGLGHGLESAEDAARTDLAEIVDRRSRLGVGATFATGDEVPRGVLRMVVGPLGYVGMVRVEDGALNVAAAVDREALAAASPAAAIDALLATAGRPPLTGAVVHAWRGTPALTRARRDVGAERLFRLGDAAGYVEPFTGEGMCWALASALSVVELAVEATRAWSPTLTVRWRAYHAGPLARSRRLCSALAWSLRRPALVGAGLAMLGRAPGLAAPVMRRAGRRPGRRLGIAPSRAV